MVRRRITSSDRSPLRSRPRRCAISSSILPPQPGFLLFREYPFLDTKGPPNAGFSQNEFWQLVVTVETAPAFLCALDQFEDHRERGPVRQTALRSDGAVAHGGEGAFDGLVVRKCFQCSAGKS